MDVEPETYDVIVIGSGNAGFSAAASASENGAKRILILEKAPSSWAGGNTTFTAGAYRTCFSGLSDVLQFVTNCPSDLASRIDMSPYSPEDFTADINRITENKADPALARVLVDESNATTRWLASSIGIRFVLSFNRQSYTISNRIKFWGGMVLAVEDGGKGLTRMHQAHAARAGIEVRYASPVTALHTSPSSGAITSVQVQPQDSPAYSVRAASVILAGGGFEASVPLRTEHLGAEWAAAYTRGTPYNTGELLQAALSLGAARAGDWGGCHSTCWDAGAARDAGSQALTNQYTKSGYPLGLMVNAVGVRFVDEGADLRNYTYARFGREILRQPGGCAFQVWDAEGAAWLREEEYAEGVVERVSAQTLEELAERLGGKGLEEPGRFVGTVEEYNAACAAFARENPEVEFDPSRKDGLAARSLPLPKSNWALPLLKPPFLAVKVACGITFTFGGLKIDPATAGVVAEKTGSVIPGLYCAGEMVGGLFWGNYPGGSGLTAGAVFGRIAGREAAERAKSGDNHRG